MRRPERRNRRIGTASSGYKKRNKMRIPESWLDKHGDCTIFWSRVEPEYQKTVRVGKTDVTILYEAPSPGHTYGCNPSDVEFLLNHCVGSEGLLPDLIIFRQPTRKQKIMSPVWGRFIYWVSVGEISGNAIILEAQEIGAEIFYPRKLSLAWQAELKQLKEDGHEFSTTKRGQVASLTEGTVRSTLLYRTLLHEIGHFRQYEANTIDPKTCLADDLDVAEDLRWSIPTSEKEAYAHKFARACSEELRNNGVIPFEPKAFHAPS